MSNGFFDQGGRWIPQAAPRHVVPLALEAAEALASRMQDGTPEPEPETRLCAGCGDELTDVEWLFDPCPDDPADGAHRLQAST